VHGVEVQDEHFFSSPNQWTNREGELGDPTILKELCRNPTLAKCGGEAQHLEKLGIWSPPRLLNVHSSTARPKTPCIGVFLVSLERY
jgi:hypothetical protein